MAGHHPPVRRAPRRRATGRRTSAPDSRSRARRRPGSRGRPRATRPPRRATSAAPSRWCRCRPADAAAAPAGRRRAGRARWSSRTRRGGAAAARRTPETWSRAASGRGLRRSGARRRATGRPRLHRSAPRHAVSSRGAVIDLGPCPTHSTSPSPAVSSVRRPGPAAARRCSPSTASPRPRAPGHCSPRSSTAPSSLPTCAVAAGRTTCPVRSDWSPTPTTARRCSMR